MIGLLNFRPRYGSIRNIRARRIIINHSAFSWRSSRQSPASSPTDRCLSVKSWLPSSYPHLLLGPKTCWTQWRHYVCSHGLIKRIVPWLSLLVILIMMMHESTLGLIFVSWSYHVFYNHITALEGGGTKYVIFSKFMRLHKVGNIHRLHTILHLKGLRLSAELLTSAIGGPMDAFPSRRAYAGHIWYNLWFDFGKRNRFCGLF